VIYVSYPKGAPVDDLWDAIWVKGKMHTVSSSHEMATASYSMEAVEVSVYEEQPPTASPGGRFVIRDDDPGLRDCPPSRLE
jgi:hypothetical protein